MEAKKFHSLLFASWRTRKVGGVIHSTSKGLRIWGLIVQVPVCIQKPQKQEHQCPSAGENRCLYSSKGWIHPFFAFLFHSGPQWTGWCPTTLVRVIVLTPSTDSNAILLQRHPQRHTQKLLLYWLSQHLIAQLGWHKKLTITRGYEGNQALRETRTKKSKTIENPCTLLTSHLFSFQCIRFILKVFCYQIYDAEISLVTQENSQDWDWNIFVPIPNSQERDYSWPLNNARGWGTDPPA